MRISNTSSVRFPVFRQNNVKHGYIHIYTGEGKGKTTASVGLALRAHSRGLKVLFVQFMKMGTNGGELDLLQQLSVRVIRHTEVKSPYFNPDVNLNDMRAYSEKALEEILISAPSYDLVVIDEFNNLVRVNIISEEYAVSFMERFPRDTELILTGRGATAGMIKRADYVTRMDAVKHPMTDGQSARMGIEY